MNLGDERRGHVPQLEPTGDDVAGPPAVGRGRVPLNRRIALAQVVSGREAGPRPADDDRRHLPVVVGRPQRVEQGLAERLVQGVALLRPVQRQAPYPGKRIVHQQQEVNDLSDWGRSRGMVTEAGNWVREDGSAAVLELIAVDRGDDRVVKTHALDGLGHPNRLAKVEHAWPPGLDGAKAASAGAGVSQDHEGCRTRLPALPDVGTARLLAHGMEVEAAHDALQL